MFRFLHAADIHLDSPLRGLERYEGAPVDEIRSATRRALVNLVDLAVDQQVDFVLLAGDLYDGDWKDHNTGLFFVEQMLRLREAKIPLIAIRGNHDARNQITKSLRLPENVQLLSHSAPETASLPQLEKIGVAVHGRSFAKAAELENMVAEYPVAATGLFNIGLLHTSLTGAEGHAPYAPCSIDDLRGKQYDYWALGHVHTRRIVNEDPPIVFPGNIQGRHIRETGEKGCIVVQVDDGGRCQLDFHPLDVFRWEQCLVEAEADAAAADVVEQIAAELSRICQRHDATPLGARVTVTGPCRAHQQFGSDVMRWTNEVRARAMEVGAGRLWVEKVRFRTSDRRSLEGGSLQGPVSELREFIEELRSDDAALDELCREFDDLRRKLPDELQRGEGDIALDDPRHLLDLLDEVQPLLIGRLTECAEP